MPCKSLQNKLPHWNNPTIAHETTGYGIYFEIFPRFNQIARKLCPTLRNHRSLPAGQAGLIDCSGIHEGPLLWFSISKFYKAGFMINPPLSTGRPEMLIPGFFDFLLRIAFDDPDFISRHPCAKTYEAPARSIPALAACTCCLFRGTAYIRPSLTNFAPVCLKWNATPASRHWSRKATTQS